MKNLQLLEGVESSVLDAIQRTDTQYRRMMKVGCDVLEYDPDSKTITVKVEQLAKPVDKIFEPKELIEKAKEVFSHLEGYSFRFRPLVWKGSGLDAVSADWVRTQMKKYAMSQRELVDELGVDEHTLSKLLNNRYEFTRWHKAAFFYYFRSRK